MFKPLLHLLIILSILDSCTLSDGNENIYLTEFTKDLVSLYVKDNCINNNGGKEEIIIICSSDTLYYCLSIFSNNPNDYEFNTYNYRGKTFWNSFTIKVFGEDNVMFYSQKKENICVSSCDWIIEEYDPTVWEIYFKRDKSFCEMKTRKETVEKDISDIRDLAKKYFRINSDNPNELYEVGEVEQEPEFIFGNDSIQGIIRMNFKQIERDNLPSIVVVVNTIVDENGNAFVDGIAKSSDNENIDNEAIRVANIVCSTKFLPAKHRGKPVKALFPIVFTKNNLRH